MTAPVAYLATPPGTSGVAVIHLTGDGARRLLSQLLEQQPPLPGERLRLRWAKAEDESSIDEILVAGCTEHDPLLGSEPGWELSCHGGRLSVERLLDRLEELGALRARPDASTQLEQEARSALLDAHTWPAARLLLHQLNGALSRERETLLELLEAGRQTAVAKSLHKLLRSYRLGRRLTAPARIQLVGPPNAGKSSLFNALLLDRRALVTATPGTTRDLLEEAWTCGGLPARLIDGAGLRSGGDELESEGVRRALEALDKADITVLVLDGSHPPEADERAYLEAILEADPDRLLVVSNKGDLAPCPEAKAQLASLYQGPRIHLSAQTGEGLEELKEELRRLLAPPFSAESEPIVFTERQRQQVDAALKALAKEDLEAARRSLQAL